MKQQYISQVKMQLEGIKLRILMFSSYKLHNFVEEIANSFLETNLFNINIQHYTKLQRDTNL